MNTECVNKRGLDTSIEVLWVFVGQSTAELPAIKDGGLKKNSAAQPGLNLSRSWPREPCEEMCKKLHDELHKDLCQKLYKKLGKGLHKQLGKGLRKQLRTVVTI